MAKPDNYVPKLRRYLRSKGSPLAPYAPLIARVEARNKLPRGIIAGISAIETSFGTAGSGPGQYNYWGWMRSGGGQRAFQNPQQAIRQYGRFLATDYLGRGLRTPQQIVSRYAPGSAGNDEARWASVVSQTMRELGGGGTAPPAAPLPSRGPKPPKAPGQAPVDDRYRKLLALQILQMAAAPDIDYEGILPLIQAATSLGPAKAPRTTSATSTIQNPGPVNPTVVSGRGLRLPATFTVTHDTDGLPGYPAHDFMAPPGTRVGAPAAGTIIRISGSNSWKSGGIGGRSIYLKTAGGTYFITHLAPKLKVKIGDKVTPGQLLGLVGNPTSGMAPHVHVGYTGLA